MNKIYAILSVLVACFMLASCAQTVSTNTYSGAEASKANQVKRGVVIAVRPVKIDNNSGAGGLAGTVAGAAAGSAIGGSGAANVVGAVGGAVVGGLLGNAIDKDINNYQGFEYIIRLKNGRTVSVVQDASNTFAVNQRVMIIYGSRTRLIADTARG